MSQKHAPSHATELNRGIHLPTFRIRRSDSPKRCSSVSRWERKSGLASNLHFELRVIHTCSHIGYVVNSAISPMKDPSVAVIGFFDLPGGYPRLLVAIGAIRANESHVFV